MKKSIHTIEFKTQAIMLVLFLLLGLSLKAQYNYLGTYNSQGKPNYLVSPGDVVSDAFLDNVDISLPESKPVPIYNPQYISSNIQTDVCLRDSAAVWVTFVAEGAGYRNVLGFYTYDMSNPPLTVDEIGNETIIFPNVSAQGSGGGLVAGDKVKIGNFPAGTGIGWFLIANGWNGSSVGSGNWKVYSNPDFNPEANANDRLHNVLLNDTTTQRVLLGFEDIRRDYSSCDQDFNDAIFYVSANPFSAIITDSINTISDSQSGVGSGGNGGLESNGELANKIAKRNFTRKKIKSTDFNAIETLPEFNIEFRKSYKNNKDNVHNLEELLPTQSLFNTQAVISTPADLVSITNAQEIFAVDYVSNNQRKGAAMVMFTENKVYEHTKAVCDRLIDAELMAIFPIEINQHPFIMFKMKQSNGDIEYAINFVIQEASNGNYTVDNNWNLGDYSNASQNYNFQIWSSTTSMTVQMVKDVISNMSVTYGMSYLNQTVNLPEVYVKKGKYSHGKLMLEIVNPTGISAIDLNGNLRRSETEIAETWNRNIELNGQEIENIEVEVGQLFDMGFSIKANNKVADILYTADGAWGTDYEKLGASITSYDVIKSRYNENPNSFSVERGISSTGFVKNYISFYKNLKTGGKAFDLSSFNALQLEIESSHLVEITFVKESINNWSEQFKTRLNTSYNDDLKIIYFDDLKNNLGQKFNGDDVQLVVVSIIGDGNQDRLFTLELNQLEFIYSLKPMDPIINQLNINPNPTSDNAIVLFNSTNEGIAKMITRNIHGAILEKTEIRINNGNNSIPINSSNYSSGIYIIQFTLLEKSYQIKFIKH